MKQWIKIFGLIQLVLAGSAVWSSAAVTVTNLVVAQRPGTKLVDITYDVSSTTTNAVTVLLTVGNGATAVSAPSVSGAVGAGVATGSGKMITWNMGADWTASVASLAFSVKADDRGIPAGGDWNAASWVVVNTRWVKNIYANGDITMSDRTNNKMWLYNANPYGRPSWSDAMSYCANLTYAGYDDWVLPDIDTLVGQYSQKEYFYNVDPGFLYAFYWSRTVYSDQQTGSRPYYMDMQRGFVDSDPYLTQNACVWPVRGGQ